MLTGSVRISRIAVNGASRPVAEGQFGQADREKADTPPCRTICGQAAELKRRMSSRDPHDIFDKDAENAYGTRPALRQPAARAGSSRGRTVIINLQFIDDLEIK